MKNFTIIKPANHINRLLYAAFVLIGILFIIFSKDREDCIIYFGIALVFDPFDQNVKWVQRPIYQRILLLVHLALLFAAIIYFVFFNHYI